MSKGGLLFRHFDGFGMRLGSARAGGLIEFLFLKIRFEFA